VSGSWHSIEIQRAIEREESRRLHLLRLDAVERARRIAALLRKTFNVSKVTLYGSLAEGGFDVRSDIDLMIDGFSGPFWRMYSEAGALADPFPLSIVCMEDAAPSLVEHVLRRGVEL
jgi:predicted nucleotidyltransferase